jgi:general secretion pathway protein G
MKLKLQFVLLLVIVAACDGFGPKKSRIAKLQIKELAGAIQLFSFDLSRYPATAEGLNALIHKPDNLRGWNGPYFRAKGVPIDPWGRTYVYKCPGEHGPYDLYSYGHDGLVGGEDEDADIVNWKNSPD